MNSIIRTQIIISNNIITKTQIKAVTQLEYHGVDKFKLISLLNIFPPVKLLSAYELEMFT